MEQNPVAEIKIQRDTLISFINGLSSGSTGSFLTPALSKKVIDFVYLLKHRVTASNEVSSLKISFVFIQRIL